MKLNTITSPVEISGAISAPSQFNIVASKEAFKILSSGLYNQKIRAIIRELSCNAWDSHVAAGKADLPFDLHLPTDFEPWFTVQDYGTGLEYRISGCLQCKGEGQILTGVDEQDIGLYTTCSVCLGTGDYDAVRDLYCSYFASNKSDSNLFVGALGLGSKSPFCYTEGFTVTNVYKEMRRIYACFLNEQGLPAVLLQSEEEVVGIGNGVTVSFPVEQEDVWEFENQASEVLEFFYPRPNINIALEVVEQQYTLKHERWALRSNSSTRGIRAIQGLVQYSIGKIDRSRLTEDAKQLLNLPLDLFFPIGELSVAASRESLSNDDRTIDNTLNALNGIKDSIVADVKEQLKACRTSWDVRLMLFRLSNQADIGTIVREAAKRGEFNDLWPDFVYTDKNPAINQLEYSQLAISLFKHSYDSRDYAKKEILTCDIPNITDPSLIASHADKYKLSFSINANTPESAFLINDVGFGVEKYIHWYLQQSVNRQYKRFYFLTRRDKNTPVDAIVRESERLLQAIGNPPVVRLSALKAEYQAEHPHTEKIVWRDLFYFNKWNANRYSNGYAIKGWLQTWEEIKPEDREALPEVKYYLPIKSREPQTGKFACAADFKEFLAATVDFSDCEIIRNTIIYGVPTWAISKLDDSWVEFTSYIAQQVIAYMTPQRELQLSLHLEPLNCKIKDYLETIAKYRMFGEHSLIQQFAIEYQQAKGYTDTQASTITTLINKVTQLGLYKLQHNVDFNKRWKQVIAAYPLLEDISDYQIHARSQRTKHGVQKYIRLIDQERLRSKSNGHLHDVAQFSNAFNPLTLISAVSAFPTSEDFLYGNQENQNNGNSSRSQKAFKVF